MKGYTCLCQATVARESKRGAVHMGEVEETTHVHPKPRLML